MLRTLLPSALAFSTLLLALALPPLALGKAPAHGETPAPAPDPAALLHALFDEAWEEALAENPLFATFLGDPRYNDRLPEVSEAAEAQRAGKRLAWLERLRAIDPSALSRQDQISHDMFRRQLEHELAEYRFRTFLMPLQPTGSFYTDFVQLPERTPFKTVRDYESYLARLAAFRTYAHGYLDLLARGIEEGRVLPGIVLAGVEEQVAPHIVDDPQASLLYTPFTRFPEGIPAAERERLAAAGRQVIAESVVPAYREILTFLVERYLPAARESVGASALPEGEAWYRHAVAWHTTLDLTPREIHELGKAEVARIRGEMETVMREVGFTGSFAEFLSFLRTDPRFYPQTPEELLSKVALILKRMDGKLPELFKTLPRTPYGLRAVPDYLAPKTYPGYYEPPAGDGSRAGFYYVNTSNLPSRPLYEYEALSFHEAVPGHHLETALSQELTDLPRFRQFGGINAYSEGWALYTERLGLEAGFYQDPYSNFGRLTYEMWRACRLVVDTGLHAFGWSRQQAIDFMAANTALSLHNIGTEVDRYIAWPGQALAYKIGELEIRKLRARAEKTLGPRFDLREFHDALLGNGPVPLAVLGENIDLHIRKKMGEIP